MTHLVDMIEIDPSNSGLWEALHDTVTSETLEEGLILPRVEKLVLSGNLDGDSLVSAARIALHYNKYKYGTKWLRDAPLLGTTYRDRVWLSEYAAPYDDDFKFYVKHADQCRDACKWSEDEWRYWEIINRFPYHAGYIVQYAHMLKEQGKFSDAEMYYRKAYALYGDRDNTLEHLIFVTRKTGFDGEIFATSRFKDIQGPLGLAPLKEDIELIYRVLRDNIPLPHQVLALMRESATIADVVANIIGTDSFLKSNHALLQLLAARTA